MILLINNGGLNVGDTITSSKEEFVLIDKIEGVNSLIRNALTETDYEYPVQCPTGTDFALAKDFISEEIIFSNAYEVDVVENDKETIVKIKSHINLDNELKDLIELLLDADISFEWVRAKILVNVMKHNAKFINEYLEENPKKILEIFNLSLDESPITVEIMNEFTDICNYNNAKYCKAEFPYMVQQKIAHCNKVRDLVSKYVIDIKSEEMPF